jgi:beta-mannosidase
MKWGFVDNYQQPKRSYEYVKRAYQPLLVNLQFDKRRWKNSEPFQGEIWIVNDFYETFKKCMIGLNILDDKGKSLLEKEFEVKEVPGNSAFKVSDLEEDILENVKEKFYVELKLSDQRGDILSANQYMLLIGDQEAASARMKAMKQEHSGVGGNMYSNYYRFFPALNGEREINWESETEVPRAKGFGEK